MRTSTPESAPSRTRAYTSGNLSNNLAVTGNRNLGTDFAGRAIIQNAIYDPATATIDSSGRRVLHAFPEQCHSAEPD